MFQRIGIGIDLAVLVLDMDNRSGPQLR